MLENYNHNYKQSLIFSLNLVLHKFWIAYKFSPSFHFIHSLERKIASFRLQTRCCSKFTSIIRYDSCPQKWKPSSMLISFRPDHIFTEIMLTLRKFRPNLVTEYVTAHLVLNVNFPSSPFSLSNSVAIFCVGLVAASLGKLDFPSHENDKWIPAPIDNKHMRNIVLTEWKQYVNCSVCTLYSHLSTFPATEISMSMHRTVVDDTHLFSSK